MDETAKLNSLAKAEIEALQAEGITLTPEEIVEINALGWAVHTPETRRTLSRGRPVPLGGQWLWPLTMRAVEWMETNNYPIGKITPAMGYAMAYGRSEGDELNVSGPDADKAVRKWMRSLRVTLDELYEAIRQADDQDVRPETPPDVEGKPMSIGDFSAFLATTIGGDPDMWERRVSMSYCLSCVSTYVMQNHAEKRPCPQDPRLIAERALGWAIEKIKARHMTAAMETIRHG